MVCVLHCVVSCVSCVLYTNKWPGKKKVQMSERDDGKTHDGGGGGVGVALNAACPIVE
jgi:hypothetical protein